MVLALGVALSLIVVAVTWAAGALARRTGADSTALPVRLVRALHHWPAKHREVGGTWPKGDGGLSPEMEEALLALLQRNREEGQRFERGVQALLLGRGRSAAG